MTSYHRDQNKQGADTASGTSEVHQRSDQNYDIRADRTQWGVEGQERGEEISQIELPISSKRK